PFVTAFGNPNNTLNTGDNLQATGAAAGTTTLNFVATAPFTANPPFATGITMNGVSTLNITNNAAATPAGFQGNITGLLVENNNNSIAQVTLGATGQGLNTLLTNININGNASPATLLGTDVNTVILAAGIADLTKTINIGITGTLGATSSGNAAEIAISNDVGGGTAASPNNTYGNWAITAAATSNLQLEQSVTTGAGGAVLAEGGVGGATGLVLAGAGQIAVGQDTNGDWQKLKSINTSGATGTLFLTGATSGAAN